MPKARRAITVHLPRYQRDREQWRKDILDCVLEKKRERGVEYKREDTFEVSVVLYLGSRKKQKRFSIHDVDNRLKDILDALQGTFGPSRSADRLIENDNRVLRVVVEKQLRPKNPNIKIGGWLKIRPFRHRQHRLRL